MEVGPDTASQGQQTCPEYYRNVPTLDIRRFGAFKILKDGWDVDVVEEHCFGDEGQVRLLWRAGASRLHLILPLIYTCFINPYPFLNLAKLG